MKWELYIKITPKYLYSNKTDFCFNTQTLSNRSKYKTIMALTYTWFELFNKQYHSVKRIFRLQTSTYVNITLFSFTIKEPDNNNKVTLLQYVEKLLLYYITSLVNIVLSFYHIFTLLFNIPQCQEWSYVYTAYSYMFCALLLAYIIFFCTCKIPMN